MLRKKKTRIVRAWVVVGLGRKSFKLGTLCPPIRNFWGVVLLLGRGFPTKIRVFFFLTTFSLRPYYLVFLQVPGPGTVELEKLLKNRNIIEGCK